MEGMTIAELHTLVRVLVAVLTFMSVMFVVAVLQGIRLKHRLLAAQETKTAETLLIGECLQCSTRISISQDTAHLIR